MAIEAFLTHIGPKKNQLGYIFMKNEKDFSSITNRTNSTLNSSCNCVSF